MSAAGSAGALIQGFFVDHLVRHKRVSSQTISAYRDTFRLLLGFLQDTHGIAPAALRLTDLHVARILAFLDHLEQQRHNTVRTPLPEASDTPGRAHAARNRSECVFRPHPDRSFRSILIADSGAS